MGALSLVPDYVCKEIEAALNPVPGKFPPVGLREDLLAIASAEAAGWTVKFRNNHWHNFAIFTRNGISVWWSGCWRVKEDDAPFEQQPRLYGTLAKALLTDS